MRGTGGDLLEDSPAARMANTRKEGLRCAGRHAAFARVVVVLSVSGCGLVLGRVPVRCLVDAPVRRRRVRRKPCLYGVHAPICVLAMRAIIKC